MPKEKDKDKIEAEPWGAANRVVQALVSEEEINVPNFFTKKQVKMFAQLSAMSVLYKKYLLRNDGDASPTWLDVLIENYKRLLKAQDGKAVKLASKVAVSTQSRYLLNLQRVKRLLVGRESGEALELG
jgi:hypothetical protein